MNNKFRKEPDAEKLQVRLLNCRDLLIRHFCKQYFCIGQIFGSLTVQDVTKFCYIRVTKNHFVVLGNIEQSLCRF